MSYIRKGLVPKGKYKLQIDDTIIEKDIKSLMDIEDDIDTLTYILKSNGIILRGGLSYNYKEYFPNVKNIDIVYLPNDGYIISSEQQNNDLHLRHIITGSNIPYINTTEYVYSDLKTSEEILRLYIIDA